MTRRVLYLCQALAMSVLLAACAGVPLLEELTGASDAAAEVESAPPAAVVREPASAEPAAAEAAPPASPDALEESQVVRPELYLGSGEFINPVVATWQPIAMSIEGEMTLNFVDADLREVIRAILGDALRVNYVIDPTVRGTVTLQTSRPLPRSAVIPTLEHILRLNGAALVQTDDLYKIVPIAKAARGTVAPRLGLSPSAHGQGFGLQIVPLEFIAAGEMEKILEPLAMPGAVVLVDPARNLLILSGTLQERMTLLEVVEIFDVDWLSGMSFALIPLAFADAETLVGDLQNVFGDEAKGPLAGLVRFVPIERLGVVLVITSRRAYLNEARDWIERFDKGGDGAEQRLYVYYVQNGRAADIANVLNEIFAPRAAKKAAPVPAVAPGLQPMELRTPAREAPRPAAEAEPAVRGEPASPVQAAAEQFGLETPAAAEPARTVTGEGVVVTEPGEIRIIADEVNNALVILATLRQYRMVQSAIRKLDILPLQVLIEVTIAEVTLNDELKYGLQWFFKAGGGHEFSLSDVATGAAAQAFPGFSYLFQHTKDVRVVLNALASVTDVNIVSSPQILVLDNQTARLQVGDQVPVVTQSAVSVADPDAPIVNTVQFVDTGVILKVTPRVNAGGLVIMEIEQEVSDVVETTTSGIDSPTIQQRQISTTVAIQSGETIALGGLIRDTSTRSNTGVPILKDIPVIGVLFGKTNDKRDRTELLVLITPRVISNQDEARAVTEELRRRLRAVIPLGEKIE